MRSTSAGFIGPDAYRGRTPSVAGSETSTTAGRGLSHSRKQRLAQLVLAHLISCGSRGSTDCEAQASIPLDGDSYRPRRVGLHSLGIIEPTSERRATPSGRLAVVWRVRAGATLAHIGALERDRQQPRSSPKAVPQPGTEVENPSDAQISFDERAARYEFDGNFSRVEAERLARIDIERSNGADAGADSSRPTLVKIGRQGRLF